MSDADYTECRQGFEHALSTLAQDTFWKLLCARVGAFALRVGCPSVADDPLDSITTLRAHMTSTARATREAALALRIEQLEKMLAQQAKNNPASLNQCGLCLLSLDGGGIRGLSTLYIVKGLMIRLNHKRQEAGLPVVKPCDIFDLIGGTSTGGFVSKTLSFLFLS